MLRDDLCAIMVRAPGGGDASWSGLDLRFRVASADLMGLPGPEPLSQWDATSAPLRDVPVGASRHLVRFVEADGSLWALKELPHRIAEREDHVLRVRWRPGR